MVLHSQISFAKQKRVPVRPKAKVPKYALELDGVDGYVSSIASIPANSNGTVILYTKVKSFYGGFDCLLSNTDNDFRIQQHDDKLEINDYTNNDPADSYLISNVFSNSVRMLAFVMTTTNSAVYLDGVLQAEKNLTGSKQALSNVLLGKFRTNVNYLFGEIGEVRIYNRALSAAEITQLSQGINVRNGLVLHHNYRLGHARDLSGNGNDGTLYGGAKFNIVNYEEV